MRMRFSLSQRLARFALLGAALLQVGGAVLGPLGHLTVLDPPAAAVGSGAGEESPDPGTAPHSEEHCVLCHSLLSLAFLPEGSTLVVEPSERSLPPLSGALHPPSTLRALPHARGPPLA